MPFGVLRLGLGLGWSRGARGAIYIAANDGEGGEQLVATAEIRESTFRAAADDLGYSTAVQDLTWQEAAFGADHFFAPQAPVTSVVNGVARCELGEDPHAVITWDDARAACQAMGPKWGMMNTAQRVVLGVIAQAHWNALGKEPTGNTDYGQSHSHPSEKGIRQDLGTPGDNDGGIARTLVGMKEGGGLLLEWFHDGTQFGVAELVGSTWDWVEGQRTVDLQLQIIPASAGWRADHGPSSTEWRAIATDGSLVAPDFSGDTIHLDTTSGLQWVAATAGAGTGTKAMLRDVTVDGVLSAAAIEWLQALGLYSWDPTNAPSVGRFYHTNVSGERMPRRGGNWPSGSNAGVFGLVLNDARSTALSYLGFRPSYVL